MKKVKITVYFSALTLSTITVPFFTHNEDSLWVKNKLQSDSSNDSKTNFKKWYDTIKDSANSNHVQLFFSRNASLSYEECMLPISYMANLNKNFKDVWLFYNQGIYSSNKWNIDSFKNKYQVKNSEGKYPFRLITYSDQISNDESKINSKTGTAYGDNPTHEFIDKILALYKDTSIKFDVWISEPSIGGYDPNKSGVGLWNQNNENFYKFFKRINKINVIADGNYQIYTFITEAIKRYESKTNYEGIGKTQEEMDKKRKEFVVDTNDSKFNEFKNLTSLDWLRDNNLFNVFNVYPYTASSYYNQTNKNKTSLYNTYYANYNYYQTALDLFGDDKSKIESFCNDYETIFNANNKNSLTDFFWKNGNKYNPKKKNLIVLGDSLTEEKKYESSVKKAELKKMFEAFFNYYPQSGYNIIFKNHPRLYTHNQQTEYVKFAIPDDRDVCYVINVPWEVILSWDYKQQLTNKKYTPLFSNVVSPTRIKSVIVSPQFSTTSIQATTAFLQNTYGYTLDDLNVVANPINFPLPYTYDYIVREAHTSLTKEKQIALNKDHADKIYQPLVDLGLYPEFKSKQLDTDTLYSRSVIYRQQQNALISKHKKEKIIVISTISGVITISVIALAIVVIKLKKNKAKPIKVKIKK